MPAPADRNLLLGILALQNGLITHEGLIAGINVWVRDKSRTMGDVLVAGGALSPSDLALLEPLVNRLIEQHGGDPQRSLAALSSVSDLRDQLASVADPDVQAVVSTLPSPDPAQTATQPPLPPDDEAPPRYRVLRPHARGGLGEVYVARDMELNRHVALKEIQAGKDHPQTRARFVLEAEITGGLEHPGIVPVYGLGHYADGRPFYAMRFIKGDNLGEAIRRFHGTTASGGREAPGPGRARAPADVVEPPAGGEDREPRGPRSPQSSPDFTSLEFRRLLQRFIDVCQAVAYAHSRGVLHRDLKPGNIMLGKYGETLVVDWGLAKTQAGPERGPMDDGSELPLTPFSGSDAAPTMAGSAIGTPAYMSPEQAEGRLDLLGPASDVYSLGATLYHLLTGRPPNAGCNRPEAMARAVAGHVPPPRSIVAAIPPPLNAICCTAMARKPADRYASAQILAADVEHWLGDEPVGAFAEPMTARVRRWIRRHPGTVAGLAAGVFIGVVGLASGLYFVNRERQRTERQAEIAQKNEREASDRQNETAAVLKFVEDQVFAAARPKDQEGGLGRDVALRDALQAALPKVADGFLDRPLIEARLRMTLGNSFSYLGQPDVAVEQSRRARELYTARLGPEHAHTLASMSNLASSYADLGRHAEALSLREETLGLCKAKLGSDHPDTLAGMNDLANTYVDLGRLAEALALREETLKLFRARLGPEHAHTLTGMSNLAGSYAGLSRHAEALALREEVLKLRKAKFGPEHPGTLLSMSHLAHSYAAVGRGPEALLLREEVLRHQKARLGPDHTDTLSSMNGLANSYAALGRHPDALALREEALRLRKAKFGPDHPSTLATMNNVANSYAALGRHPEALAMHEETFRLRKAKQGAEHPDTLLSMNNLASSQAALGRHQEALPLREEALRLQKARLGPDHADTLLTMNNLAENYVFLDRTADAVMLIDETFKRAVGKPGVHPKLIPGLIANRLRVFAKERDGAGCRATADMWDKLDRRDAASLYQAACNRAVCAAVMSGRNEVGAGEQADQSMAWLTKAVAAGYSNVEHVKADKDLDVLRDRPDFRQLIRQMAAKTAQNKKD